jgi:transcriptional regulator with XRE-family HTH domain
MDAFDRIFKRTPEITKRNLDKNLAIANRILEILNAQGKSQRDLSRALGKSESEISKWLTGLHNLELHTIYKIEAALGEDVIEVIGAPVDFYLKHILPSQIRIFPPPI